MTLRHSLRVSTLCLLTGAALAAAGANEGGLQIRPKIGIAATNDSNIFLAPKNATSAWIAQPSAALGIGIKGKKSSLMAGYEIAPQVYSVWQKVNNAVHQTAALSAQVEYMPEGLIGLDDQFRVTADPASSELTARSLRNQNDGAFLFDLPIGSKLYAGLRVVDTIHHYRVANLAPLLDRNEMLAGLRLGLRPSAKTKVYGFFKSSNVNFKSASSYNDSTGSLVGAGVEGEITSRITGLIEANSVARKYSKTLTGETTDYTTGGFTASLKWDGPSSVNVALAGGRSFVESVFNRYYMQTGGSLAVTKELNKRFSVQVLGAYGVDQYPDARAAFLADGTLLDARRKDTNMTAGLSLSYHLVEKQTFKLGYLMRSRSSNFDTYKYTDGQLTLSADYLL
jgi:hypothetical protein